MKIRKSQFDKAWNARDMLRLSPKEGDMWLLRELGIEIVPDPETEPERPVVLRDESPDSSTVRDSSGTVLFRCHHGTLRGYAALRALVSAYNAAEERKRIEVRDGGPAESGRWIKATVNGEGDTSLFTTTLEAIGWYVRRHASDLGLEIVES